MRRCGSRSRPALHRPPGCDHALHPGGRELARGDPARGPRRLRLHRNRRALHLGQRARSRARRHAGADLHRRRGAAAGSRYRRLRPRLCAAARQFPAPGRAARAPHAGAHARRVLHRVPRVRSAGLHRAQEGDAGVGLSRDDRRRGPRPRARELRRHLE